MAIEYIGKHMDAAWELILAADHVIITTHERADGDGFGALLAFSSVLSRMYPEKRITRMVKDGTPVSLEFLAQGEEVVLELPANEQRTTKPVLMVLDASELSRTGFAEQIRERRNEFNIVSMDHHTHGEYFGDVNIVNEYASSTCELMYDFLSLQNAPIDMHAATCLLAGIFTDTGSFQHSNTSAHALKIASELMAKGARLNKISKQLYSNKQEAALRIWGETLARVKVLPKYGLAVSIITSDDLKKYNAHLDDVSGVVSMMNTIPGIKASLLLVQTEDGHIKGSLRSEEGRGVDVSKLARIFGGGGHRLASGFTIEGKLEKTNSHWQVH